MKKINWKYVPKKETITSPAQDLLFEKRLLTLVTCLLICGLITWLIGVSTDYWLITIYYKHSDLLWSHSGLWKKCDIAKNEELSKCEYTTELLKLEVTIVSIVLALISVSCGFSVYSL